MDDEGKKLPSEKYAIELDHRLKDPKQWDSIEAYAVSYLRDRFYCGPVGWFTDIAMEKIYLKLCFTAGGQYNTRYTALRALYELWLKQEAQEAPDTIRVH